MGLGSAHPSPSWPERLPSSCTPAAPESQGQMGQAPGKHFMACEVGTFLIPILQMKQLRY